MVAFQNVLPKFNPEKRCKPKSLNQSSSFRLGFKSNENEVAQLKKELKEHFDFHSKSDYCYYKSNK